ncbi:MAG: ABC transporter ATP-binding protein [Synergistaceae bacterium]|jgi:oligopeptide/dipeptide ABC transporter ATP-binding protein|nr:ABC transporter ATP-binding protein [Synergistaceae bacterium]
MPDSSLLEIKNLSVGFKNAYGVARVVDGIDVSVARGEIVGIVGESGCGKTVTVLSVMGLLPGTGWTSGEILFGGEDLLKKNDDEMRAIRGDRISMIFQEPMTALNPVMTIGRQICEPLMLHKSATRSDAARRAVEILDLVRVPQASMRMKSYPHQLSGGLCQRAMIAMALICEPMLLIADEPTTALDVTIQAQILSLLLDLKERLGTTILMITHDLGVVAELCDRVYVMYAGHIMEEADVRELFARPLHPYTSGLLRSLPRVDGGANCERHLYSIPGMVPGLGEVRGGCPFEPRCESAMKRCGVSMPPLNPVFAGHNARCWLFGESASDAAR